MSSLARRERALVIVWLVLAFLIWNAIYDLLLTRGIKEYLLRNALFVAGRGPDLPMARVLDLTVREALWVSTFWTSIILLAAVLTVRVLRRA